MRTPRTFTVVAVATITALATGLPMLASADESSPPTTQTATGAEREYVVAYKGDRATVDAAVRAAGGTVVDVNSEVGLAKVSTRNDGFLRTVRRQAGVRGAARNNSVATVKPGMKHKFADERPSVAEKRAAKDTVVANNRGRSSAEPLADRQWDMEMIDADAAHRKATGRGVDVGIIDTGIDATHPDLKRNFDKKRSRNFTMDIPAIDGPCEYSTCIDPANVDHGGHGTHVAGTVAADDNGFGIGGVAPDARLINLRAGQDSGYFFLYETVAALVAAGEMKLDVVNMSFYTDPWLYNCASKDDYISGTVSDEEIAQQALTRELVLSAVTYASERGVTLVGSAGNGLTNLALPTRTDDSSPDYPEGAARERVVTDNCLDLPNEAPEVISVSSVGPSGTKADYSNYGLGDIEVAAPGGWFRDGVGTSSYMTAGNMILSTYPLQLAIDEGLADENGDPVDAFSVKYCNAAGVCGFYTSLQGTSMASPHVSGVAALIVDRYGRSTRGGGQALNPARVRRIIERTAVDHACPAGGTEIYTDEGRPPSYNAICEGSTDYNGLYGEGIVNAARAVGVPRT
ncbi:MAG TPA: S8 family serine peptidase [Propionibacteriaceae bacterium]